MTKTGKNIQMGRIIFVCFMLVVFMIPFYLVLNNSFRTTELFVNSPFKPALRLNFTNYSHAFEKMNFLNAIKNSALITFISVLFILITGSMAAYFLVRNKWKINRIIFAIMTAAMIVPFQAIMIPLVRIYGYLNAANNKWMLIFMYIGFGQPFAVFIFHGFIKNIPLELEESSLIDGCGKIQSFFLIALPNLMPIMVTVLILDVLWIWNDYLLPSMILLSPAQRTLPLSTYSFFSTYSVDFAPLMAGLVLSVIPVILLYLFCQKQIINGVMQGAIK
jgi:raffinose/stachyose/melibiose transport system permease protein